MGKKRKLEHASDETLATLPGQTTRRELTLTKSASGVWFTMDGGTLRRLKECGIDHPIPDADIKLATKTLVAAGHRVSLQDPTKGKPRKTRREKRIRDLALAIATGLFTDGQGTLADRLVMEHANGTERSYGGGWALGPMADRIEMILLADKFPPFSE